MDEDAAIVCIHGYKRESKSMNNILNDIFVLEKK